MAILIQKPDRPMAERQIKHRKLRLVLSVRFLILIWLCVVFTKSVYKVMQSTPSKTDTLRAGT